MKRYYFGVKFVGCEPAVSPVESGEVERWKHNCHDHGIAWINDGFDLVVYYNGLQVIVEWCHHSLDSAAREHCRGMTHCGKYASEPGAVPFLFCYVGFPGEPSIISKLVIALAEQLTLDSPVVNDRAFMQVAG